MRFEIGPLKKALKAIPGGASDAEAIKVFDRDFIDAMLTVNKCPDFMVIGSTTSAPIT